MKHILADVIAQQRQPVPETVYTPLLSQLSTYDLTQFLIDSPDCSTSSCFAMIVSAITQPESMPTETFELISETFPLNTTDFHQMLSNTFAHIMQQSSPSRVDKLRFNMLCHKLFIY
jgi:hypothetical protein